MKAAAAVALLAVATGNVSAQSLTPSYITIVTYKPCTPTLSAPVPTITDVVETVITTCPECLGPKASSNPSSSSSATPSPIPTHVTVYTTSYATLCSTGWTANVYTVTETCTGATPTWPRSSSASNYVPPGFTTTVTVCTICNTDHSPVTATLTIPCPPTGSSSVPAPNPTPLTSSNGGGIGGISSRSRITTPAISPTTPGWPQDTTTTITTCPGAPCQYPSSSIRPVVSAPPSAGGARGVSNLTGWPRIVGTVVGGAIVGGLFVV